VCPDLVALAAQKSWLCALALSLRPYALAQPDYVHFQRPSFHQTMVRTFMGPTIWHGRSHLITGRLKTIIVVQHFNTLYNGVLNYLLHA
jgi:hypothetical protein